MNYLFNIIGLIFLIFMVCCKDDTDKQKYFLYFWICDKSFVQELMFGECESDCLTVITTGDFYSVVWLCGDPYNCKTGFCYDGMPVEYSP